MKFGMCLCAMFLAGSLPAAEIVITTNAARTNDSPIIAVPRTNAFKGIAIKKGFRLELVASEPLVVNPGAMAFDEMGRLFILEAPEGQPGRVRLLEDTDGDGVFDTSRIYAENLYGASALACYGGGVFVGATGEIIYLKDTAGDGRADLRRVVFNSFGDATNGVNGLVIYTAMVWGMDNRLHVTTASRGGDIISSSSPKQSLVMSAGSFSFDPRTFALADESGSGPSGMSFDNRGRKFVSSPASHLSMVMYESRYAARNPFWQMPDVLLDITEGGSGDVIYPIARGEIVPVQFSAPAGLAIYRGYLFPPDYLENAFVADTSANIVHRDKLQPGGGIELIAGRAPDEAGSEFLAVSDNSFQPAAFAGGPEGALYVAGPAREAAVSFSGNKVKTNAPPQHGFGRIYRLVPVTFKQPPPAQLGKAALTNLVNTLRHSDGWRRDTAERLLYERQDKAAIVPLIQLFFDPRSPPLSRVYALHALDGLQTLVPGHIVRALIDPDDRVREHAVLLSEKFLANGMIMPDAIWGQLAQMAGDPSPRVRYQLAFTLGQCRNPGRAQPLADTLRSDPDSRWLRAAVLSSLNEGAGQVLGLLAADGNFRNGGAGRECLGQLAEMIGEKNQPEELSQAMADIAAIPEVETAFAVAGKLGDGLQAAKSSLAAADTQGILRPLYASATRFTIDLNATESSRIQALRLLDAAGVWDGQTSAILMQQWPLLTPRLRNELITALSSQANRAAALILALEVRTIPQAALSMFQIKFLLADPDVALRQRAANLYGNPAIIPRENVVSQFAGAAQMAGSRERGRVLFIARCGDCHQLGNDGNSAGQVLKGMAAIGKEKLLVKILDPNREISASNSALLVLTGNGDRVGGNVVAQSARTVTVCQPNGELRVISRQNVQGTTPLGISAMPEGLEAGLNQQDLADLLEFLCSAAP